jgi:PAS domain-containing protein
LLRLLPGAHTAFAPRSAPACTTPGHFDDPLLNTFLRLGTPQVAPTVFDELAHQPTFVPDDPLFNESFATAKMLAPVARTCTCSRKYQLTARYPICMSFPAVAGRRRGAQQPPGQPTATEALRGTPMKDKLRRTAKEQPSLRERAEAKISAGNTPAGLAAADAAVLHELQVHQIELEMQNESLRQAHATLEEAHDRYLDLYDLSPVGYVTLRRNGRIAEVNLTVASLFGVDRNRLINRGLASSLAAGDADRAVASFLCHANQPRRQSEMRRRLP